MKVRLLAAIAVLFLMAQSASAQTLVTLKAYSKPTNWSGNLILYFYTTSSFSCGGTMTNKLIFVTAIQMTESYDGKSNASFIEMSELIDAAKKQYPLELVSMSYLSGEQACLVNNYYIIVQ